MRPKPNLVLFCGGRGAASIITSIVKCGRYNVHVLLNAFDDGKSTGVVRKMFKMLGPSDIRKVQILLSDMVTSDNLVGLFNLRLGTKAELEAALKGTDAFLLQYVVSPSIRSILSEYLLIFSMYFFNNIDEYDYADFSVGNCIYAGCYAKNNNDLNKTIAEIGRLMGCKGVVSTLTDESLYLNGVDESGKIYFSESEIDEAFDAQFRCISISKFNLEILDKGKLNGLTFHEKIELLNSLSTKSRISKDSMDILRVADVIIYAPGTRSTSFLPSFMIDGVANEVVKNAKAKKIFICNLKPEYKNHWRNPVEEIMGLLELTKTAKIEQLISHCLVDETTQTDDFEKRFKVTDLIKRPFSDRQFHDGNRIVEVLDSLI